MSTREQIYDLKEINALAVGVQGWLTASAASPGPAAARIRGVRPRSGLSSQPGARVRRGLSGVFGFSWLDGLFASRVRGDEDRRERRASDAMATG